MKKDLPLCERLYFDPVLTEVVRTIGYAGCQYRELYDKLKLIADQYGKQRVESAIYQLLTFEGENRCNPPPLAMVSLRENVRKLAWGLLGPPPEHPWFEAWKKPEPLPNSWDKPKPAPGEQGPGKSKKRTGKKKTA